MNTVPRPSAQPCALDFSLFIFLLPLFISFLSSPSNLCLLCPPPSAPLMPYLQCSLPAPLLASLISSKPHFPRYNGRLTSKSSDHASLTAASMLCWLSNPFRCLFNGNLTSNIRRIIYPDPPTLPFLVCREAFVLPAKMTPLPPSALWLPKPSPLRPSRVP